MNQQQYGGSLGGPIARDRTFFFANVEQRLLDQTGLVDDHAGERRRSSTRGWRAVGYPGSPVTTGVYPNPGAQRERARQDRSPVQRPRSVQRPLRLYRRHVGQLARRRRR